MKALFDTNILIDYLNGVPDAKTEIELYQKKLISVISWIEVMVGVKDPSEGSVIESFLSYFEIIHLDMTIAEISVNIRKEQRLRIPDSIILATAISQDALLITRNTKDFTKKNPNIRVPYVIK